jgi:hypothetical protein
LPGTYRAGFPELLDLTPPEGDALAAMQAERVLAEQADHPEARRLRAPLRLGSDPAGALDDMDTYLRQEADPLTQVRVLTLRNQINAAAPANAPAPQPAWTGFALTADADDGALYFHAASALGAFIDEVPASQATLRPLLEAACRKGLACFESYFPQAKATRAATAAMPILISIRCCAVCWRVCCLPTRRIWRKSWRCTARAWRRAISSTTGSTCSTPTRRQASISRWSTWPARS